MTYGIVFDKLSGSVEVHAEAQRDVRKRLGRAHAVLIWQFLQMYRYDLIDGVSNHMEHAQQTGEDQQILVLSLEVHLLNLSINVTWPPTGPQSDLHVSRSLLLLHSIYPFPLYRPNFGDRHLHSRPFWASQRPSHVNGPVRA